MKAQEEKFLEHLRSAGHELEVARYGAACRNFGESLARLVPAAKAGEKVDAAETLQLLHQLRQELILWVRLQRLHAESA